MGLPLLPLLALLLARAGPGPPPMEVFVQRGCPHCAAAQVWLDSLQRARPEVRFTVSDVAVDDSARTRLVAIARARGWDLIGVPVFVAGDRVVKGWQDGATTGRQVLGLLGLDTVPARPPDEIEAPFVGSLSATKLGLPLFTLAVGLLDGFNPCAMWALLLVLSLLVNLRSRARMLAIGATFVGVGGVLYFLFMAAWLELFLFVGLSRPLQVGLGLVAIAVGLVNVKDFVAFGTGPSLSIPASAKPGLYARMRRVLAAENLPAALAAVAVLSAAVNLVELLCTAGLPTVYTQILASHDLSRPVYYAYLGLYIGGYVLDDMLMLVIAATTLSQPKLQERAGRWLKLLSGLVMTGLGLLLLLKPEWLR